MKPSKPFSSSATRRSLLWPKLRATPTTTFESGHWTSPYDWKGDTELALPSVIRALDDSDRIVRICAASVVSQHVGKATQATPILLKWLDSDDEHSRLTAASLVLKIEPSKQEELLAVLAEGMNSNDTGIRCLTAWLLSGLREVTPDALPVLRQLLGDEGEFVRSVAAEELGSLKR